MNARNLFLMLLCIGINLAVGTGVMLFTGVGLSYTAYLLMWIMIAAVYVWKFYNVSKRLREPHWSRLALQAVQLSLSALIIACIVLSVQTRMEFDSVFTAALKGVIPLSVFAVVFMLPVWLALAAVNFICLKSLKQK